MSLLFCYHSSMASGERGYLYLTTKQMPWKYLKSSAEFKKFGASKAKFDVLDGIYIMQGRIMKVCNNIILFFSRPLGINNCRTRWILHLPSALLRALSLTCLTCKDGMMEDLADVLSEINSCAWLLIRWFHMAQRFPLNRP